MRATMSSVHRGTAFLDSRSADARRRSGGVDNGPVHLIAIAAAALAAGVHVWFFALESLWFMRPLVYRRFGVTSAADARVVQAFAFNQGFYNLFLAVGVAAGIALVVVGQPLSGRAIVLFSCAAMVAAGIVLARFNGRGAAMQAIPPFLAILATVILG